MKMYDFNVCPLSDRNGLYGGSAGDKEGVIIDGEKWIIKYPKNTKDMRGVSIPYTTSPQNEYIGSHIFSILGIPAHETRLGTRNGKIVVACKDFLGDADRLGEYRQLRNTYRSELANELDTSEFASSSSDHFVSLEEVMIHIRENPIISNVNGISDFFWDMFIVDALINNNDRNSGNWGIIKSPEGWHVAPVFDNGNCFINKMSPEKALRKIPNIKLSSLNTALSFGLKGKGLHVRDLLTLDIPEFKNAVIRMVPIIECSRKQIELIINEIPEKYKGMDVLGNSLKSYIKADMNVRYEEILLRRYKQLLAEKIEKIDDSMKDAITEIWGEDFLDEIEELSKEENSLNLE